MMRKCLIVMFVLLMGVSASAVSFDAGEHKLDIYASVRGGFVINSASSTDYYDEITSANLFMQSNSRAGARWNWSNYFANFEMGLNAASESTSLRYLYAGYKSDTWGTLRFGLFDGISTLTAIGRVGNTDNALIGFGNFSGPRRPGASYSHKGFEVKVSTLDPDKGRFTGLLTAAAGYSDVRFKEFLPRIELAYKIPVIPVTVAGSYALFSADAISGGERIDIKLSAWHTSISVAPKFDKISFDVTGFYSVNTGLIGMARTNSKANPTAPSSGYLLPIIKNADGDFYDMNTYGFAANFRYSVTSKVMIGVGGGYQNASSDAWKDNDDNMALYTHVQFRPNKWLRITPEITYMDFMTMPDGLNNGIDDTKVIQAGVQLRLDI